MTREIEFTKMHGAGNDFMVLDGLSAQLPPLEQLARRFSDRQRGVGFDQMLVIRPSQTADFRMEIYDADGSQVEMCGNGIRAVFKYLRDRRYTEREAIRVETLGGIVVPQWVGDDLVRVDMGQPTLAPPKIPTRLGQGDGPVLDAPLRVDGETLTLSCVAFGNPHAILYVDDVDRAPVRELGPKIERNDAFPNRVNVSFAQLMTRDRIRQRTWERGTGETLACGSGACATAVVSMLRGAVDRRVTVELPGGDLRIEWPQGGNVLMTGPAAEVFTGRLAV